MRKRSQQLDAQSVFLNLKRAGRSGNRATKEELYRDLYQWQEKFSPLIDAALDKTYGRC